MKNVFYCPNSELIATDDLFENNDFVIFESTVKYEYCVVKNLEVGCKGDHGDIVSIQTVCSNIIS